MLKMSNETYDALKWVALYLLPALATFYSALAGLWGFPYGEAIVGTISAFDIFLASILKISTDNYNRDQNNETDK